MKIGMAGGGIASLFAAYELKKREDFEIEIYEQAAENKRGGLLKTVEFGGRKVDVGGPHILFSSNEKILNRILDFVPSAKKHKRIAKIVFDGNILDYPIENGIWKLSKAKRQVYIDEMLHLPAAEPSNMKEFFEYTFGESLTKDYFIPYNQKIWKWNPKQMETTWTKTSGRLPTPNPEKLKLALEGIPQEGYEIQSNFWYPTNGIQELYDNVTKKCLDLGVNIKYESQVANLTTKDLTVEINPAKISYDYVFSSLPLPIVSHWYGLNSDYFKHNPVTTVTIMLRNLNHQAYNGDLQDAQVLYVPEQEIPFHRLVFTDKFQEEPENLEGEELMVELTGFGYLNMDNLTIMHLVVGGLQRLGLISGSEDVAKFKVVKNYYGYPIDVIGASTARESMISKLKEKRILSIGRWGRWSYWNIDKVYMNALDVVSSFFS